MERMVMLNRHQRVSDYTLYATEKYLLLDWDQLILWATYVIEEEVRAVTKRVSEALQIHLM